MALTTVRFLAVAITGLALVAPAAHLFVLANKIGLPRDQYFIVQGIYNGWWMLGLLLPLAVLANIAHAWLARADGVALTLALLAAGLVVVELLVFVAWTQPANAATRNWTVQPDNWEALRRQWEYSHAANAGIMFAAFCCAIAAAMRPLP
jgi:hypothetical protein